MKLTPAITTFYLLLLLAFSTGTSNAQIEFTEVKTASDWEQITAEAQKSGKLIFLDVYATWCGPCKYLEKNVYTNPTLGTYYNANYISAKMDGETDFGATFARAHQLEAYPTMFFLDGKAGQIAKIVGVREAEPLKEIGKTIVENSEKIAYYAENFPTEKLSLSELQNYQAILSTLGQDEKAAEVGAAILPSLTEEDILNPAYKDIILAASPDLDSKVFQILKNNRSKLEENWTKVELNQLFGMIFNHTLSEAIANKDPKLMERIIAELLPVYLDSPEDIKSGAYITQKIFFANTDQWKKYSDLVLKEYTESHQGDDKFLYSEVSEIAKNYSYSDEALEWAKVWINKALEINRSFDNVVIAAYIDGMKGEFDTANALVTEAGSMELTEEQKTMLDELKKVIDQAAEQAKTK